jgi:rhodanese-related sulfurtransferase
VINANELHEPFRAAVREAMLLVALSIALGFAYTYLTERGFFSPTFASASVAPDRRVIPADSVHALFRSQAAIFIDSRRTFEYDAGHIPGAMSLPVDEFDSYKIQFEGMPRTQAIVVYCDGMECNSSMTVATRLSALGFSNVRVFFGGWKEWIAAGHPVEGASR